MRKQPTLLGVRNGQRLLLLRIALRLQSALLTGDKALASMHPPAKTVARGAHNLAGVNQMRESYSHGGYTAPRNDLRWT